MKVFGRTIDVQNVVVPTILVGIIAGASTYLEKQSLGWKAALGAGIATFLITVAQELLNGKKEKVSIVKVPVKRRVNSRRLFPGQR